MTSGDELSEWATPPTPEEQEELERERTERALKAMVAELKGKNRALHKALDLANDRLDVALAITGPPKIKPIEPRKRSRAEATAVVLASDWHVYQRVNPANVNGVNEFTPKIADRRIERLFRNIVRLTEFSRTTAEVKTLVLWFGGDLVAGYIHEELVESNFGSPIEEIEFCRERIIGGIQYLLEEGGFDRIICPTSFGNHGRTTERKKVSTAAVNSFEWLLYNSLAHHFRDHDQVDVLVSTSEITYLDIYDFTYRFFHGDRIGGGTGIGGITIPIRRAVANYNKARSAYMTCMGHFHQLFFGPEFVVNGCLVGYDEFSQNIVKAQFEPPRQAYFLSDARYGRTICAPILLEG